MIEPRNETIDGIEFYFQPLPAFTALKLDKQIISLIAPALGGLDSLDNLSLDTDINLKVITQGIGKALDSFDSEEYEKFILSLLSFTLHIPGDGKNTPQPIDKQKFDQLFTGNLQTVYKLIFAVMKYNKFLPFVLGEGGPGMKKILSLLEKTKKEKVNGKESEK